MTPKVLPEVLERWKRSIESGTPFQVTFPLRGKDGVFRPFFTLIRAFEKLVRESAAVVRN